jgi:hypothetical protein
MGAYKIMAILNNPLANQLRLLWPGVQEMWEKGYIKDFGDPQYKAYPINEPLLKEIKTVLELFNEQGIT